MKHFFQFETPWDENTGLSLPVSNEEYAVRAEVHSRLRRSAERRLARLQDRMRRAMEERDFSFDLFHARKLADYSRARIAFHAELAIANRSHAP